MFPIFFGNRCYLVDNNKCSFVESFPVSMATTLQIQVNNWNLGSSSCIVLSTRNFSARPVAVQISGASITSFTFYSFLFPPMVAINSWRYVRVPERSDTQSYSEHALFISAYDTLPPEVLRFDEKYSSLRVSKLYEAVHGSVNLRILRLPIPDRFQMMMLCAASQAPTFFP